jgi:hypothetical protein
VVANRQVVSKRKRKGEADSRQEEGKEVVSRQIVSKEEGKVAVRQKDYQREEVKGVVRENG